MKNAKHLILSLLLLSSLIMAPYLFAAETPSGPGGTLLFSFVYRQDKVELKNIGFYDAETRIKRLTIPHPWRAILLDASGKDLFSLKFPNPLLISPPDQTLPIHFEVRVPYLKDAVLFQLEDESERVIYQINLSADLLRKGKERRQQIERDLQQHKERTEGYYRKFGKLPARVGEKRPTEYLFNREEESLNMNQGLPLPEADSYLPRADVLAQSVRPPQQYLQPDQPLFEISGQDAPVLVPGNSGLDCANVIDLTLDVPYRGTTTGGTSNVNSYSCLIGFDLSGPEKVHRVTTTTPGHIAASIANAANLVLFILNSCSSQSCLSYGGRVEAVYPNAPPGTYYVAVDAVNGQSGEYTLTVSMAKVLSGKVTDENGLGLSGIELRISRQDEFFSTLISADSSGGYQAYVPLGTYEIEVHPPGGTRYLHQKLSGVTVSGNTQLNIQLKTGYFLSGTVKDLVGAPVKDIYLIPYLDRERLDLSMISTNANGHYSMTLEMGTYDLHVWPLSGYFPKWINEIVIDRDTVLDIQLDQKTNLSVTVYDSFQNKVAGAGVQIKDPDTDQAWDGADTDSSGVALVSIPNRQFKLIVNPPSGSPLLKKIINDVNSLASTLDVTLQRGNVLSGTVYIPTGPKAQSVDVFAVDEKGKAVNAVQSNGQGEYSMALPSGTFMVQARDASGDYGEAQITINSDLAFDFHMISGAVQTVSGSVRDGKGNLVSGSIVKYFGYTGAGSFLASGQFTGSILSSSKYGIIFPPPNTRFLLKTFDITPGMSWDFVLDELPETPDGTPLSLIYGDPNDKSRLNFVIIGDGYTDLNEPFTDSNKNGVWDGDLYLDENRNGKYDPGEYYYERNWNGVYDPPEPFTDTNGDGVRNFNEQAIFDQNALDLARSLLGSPVIKDYAGRINIWKVRVISNQTCGDFPEFGIKRDTALNTTYDYKYRGFIIDIDFGKAAEIIQALLHEYDYIITLSYCPLGIGRLNSVFGGGVAMNAEDRSLVDLGLVHEYGHIIGLLGDEYTEFPGMYPKGEPPFPNVTTVLDETKIKWKDYLSLTTPSPPHTQGVGAFEGADYYSKGVYRPASRCVMDMWVQFCPVCQDEMVGRLNELSGGSEAISTPNKPDGSTAGLAGISYTYKTNGSASNLGHPVQYRFDWGDGVSSDWLPVGTATASKAWLTVGPYRVKSQARCADDTSVFSGWSSGLRVELSVPPEDISRPDTPGGPTSGQTGISLTYTANGSSSNLGHSVEYQFDWKGDGSDLSGWGSATQSKTWSMPGSYNVRAQARCKTDTSIFSGWSSALTINITAVPYPDLTGQWGSGSLLQVCRNTRSGKRCNLAGSFSVQNSGNKDTSSSFYISFYLSADNVLSSGDDSLLKRVSVGKMKKGANKMISLNVNLAPGVTVSGKYVIAVIDFKNAVTESSENNNQIAYGPMP
jgi:hypothetical protein